MRKKQISIILKKASILSILIILIFATHISASWSTPTIHIAINSAGTIKLKTATTSLNVSQAVQNNLELTGFGEDYLIAYDDTSFGLSPEIWLEYNGSRLQRYEKWNMKAARLGFRFADCPRLSGVTTSSTYDQEKMDRVIEILYSNGILPILNLHNVNEDMKDYIGSWNWINNWKSVAQHYKGDVRIAAFQIFNEPFAATWANTGPLGSIIDARDLLEICAYLVNEIHAIDPNRVIVFPCFMVVDDFSVYGWPLNWTSFYEDLIDNGMIQDKVIFDIVHPYYFEIKEYDMGYTPLEKVAWYSDNFVIPAVNLFGANKCWVGETFAWYPADHGDQVQFLTGMIDVFVEYNVDFQILSYFSKCAEAQAWQEEGLAASTYL